jgi:hypothetical protein
VIVQVRERRLAPKTSKSATPKRSEDGTPSSLLFDFEDTLQPFVMGSPGGWQKLSVPLLSQLQPLGQSVSVDDSSQRCVQKPVFDVAEVNRQTPGQIWRSLEQ